MLQIPGATVLTSVTFSYKDSECGESVTMTDNGYHVAEGMKTTGECERLENLRAL